MADRSSVKKVTEAAAQAFGLTGGPPEKDGLIKLMNDLVELLSNADGLDIATINAVWKASRKLQSCVENDDLNPAVLADVYLILIGDEQKHTSPKSAAPPKPAPESKPEPEPQPGKPTDEVLEEEISAAPSRPADLAPQAADAKKTTPKLDEKIKVSTDRLDNLVNMVGELVIDGQMVRVGEEKYIIPINNIRRSFRPTEDQISTVHSQHEMVLVRNELLPLVRLHELFEVEPDSTNPCEGLVVIVKGDNEACCMLVDDLLDQQQVVINDLGPLLNQTEGVSGGAIMGDGMVRLILDIPGVIKLYSDPRRWRQTAPRPLRGRR